MSIMMMGGGSPGGAAILYQANDSALPGSPRKWFEVHYQDGLSVDDTPIDSLEDHGSDGVDPTSTLTKRPTYKTDQSNGLPAISLDGGDYMLITPWATSGNFTICQRFKVGAAALDGNFCSWGAGSYWVHYQSSSTNHWVYSAGVSANFTQSYAANTYYTTILVRSVDTLKLYVNGVLNNTLAFAANLSSLQGLWASETGWGTMEASLIFVHAVYTQAFSPADQLEWHNGYNGVYN